MRNRKCFLLPFYSIIIYIVTMPMASAQIFVPQDDGGWYIMDKNGLFLEIRGIDGDPDVPPLESLIDVVADKCAHYRLVDEYEWDCGNTPRHGILSMNYSKLVQIYFDPKCDGQICFFAKDHPEFGKICYDNDESGRISATTEMRDRCNIELKRRNDVLYPSLIDMDEIFYFSAILSTSDPDAILPYSLYGTVSSDGTANPSILMVESASGPGYKEYRSIEYRAYDFFLNSNYGILTFQIPYGQLATYSIGVDTYVFEIKNFTFADNILMSSNRLYPTGNPSVCYPFNTIVKLGTIVKHLDGWPSTCFNHIIYANGYSNESLVFETTGVLFIENPTETQFVSSAIRTSDYFHADNIDINWSIIIEGPGRYVPPARTNLTVYNGFQAMPIRIPNPPENNTIHVGDQLRLWAVPNPFLIDQQRIIYDWYAFGLPAPSGSGHFIFSNPNLKFKIFVADSPGNVQLNYAVRDNISGSFSNSMPLSIHIEPSEIKLIIETPIPSSQYFIDATPAMPRIACRAHLEGVSPEDQSSLVFNWAIDLNWNSYSYHKAGTVTGPVDWVPAFGSDFAGGDMTLDAYVQYNGQIFSATLAADQGVKVLGTNPAEVDIRTYLEQGYSDPDRKRQAVVICGMESSYQQFVDGKPKMSGDGRGGVGLMQITYPAPSIKDCWNWKTNVDDGKAVIQAKWDDSNNWFDRRIRQNWPIPTTDERLYDTYCRYNGGHYYSDPPLGDNEPCPPCYHRNRLWRNQCGVCFHNNPQSDIGWNDLYHQWMCMQSGQCYADQAMIRHKQ